MTATQLNAYLHAHISLSRAMGLHVLHLDAQSIRVGLPLANNLNPHGTVFGGSLTALGLASAWMFLYARFEAACLPVKLVGKRSECDFLAPATGDCVAETTCESTLLDNVFAHYVRAGHARLELTTLIRVGATEVARHCGLYTALKPETDGPSS